MEVWCFEKRFRAWIFGTVTILEARVSSQNVSGSPVPHECLLMAAPHVDATS